jgi:hypothetical protein
MRFESFVMIEMLLKMEQLGAVLRPRFDQIAQAVHGNEYTAALATSAELVPVLDTFAATTATLQVHVVTNDGMGEPAESLGELVLRARALVIVAQLGRLRDAFRDPAVRDRSRRWFVGCCESITDMTAYVQGKLSNIHAIWLPYRQDRPQPAGMTEPDRASLHRIAVRVAQRAVCELPDEPEVAHFLKGGLAATDLTEVYMACKQMQTVFSVRIDLELGRHLLAKPRAHSPNSNAQKHNE